MAGLSVSSSYASPWASPGDSALRADVELLAHHGLISGPVNTWPMSWKQITSGFYKADAMTLPTHVQRALDRVRNKIPGEINGSARIAATNNPNILRGFGYTPRNDLSISSSIEFNANTGTTVHVEGGYRKGTGEDYVHLDGSYISQDIGNWAVYAGAIDRWWGPGQESTLILSNNARPIPSIGLRRIEAKPFKTKWLSWMGPWSWDMFISKMEKDRHIPNPVFAGMRLSMEPFKNFEIGFSRTLQLCGVGRPCNFTSWSKALISVGDLDNPSDRTDLSQEPGNQLANIELSYSFNINKSTSMKLYADGTGEDFQYFIPFKYAKLIGIETNGLLDNFGNQWKLTIEYSDTLSQHGWIIGTKQNRTLYNHHIYRSGYRYLGNSIGHTLDTDADLITLGAEINYSEWWYFVKIQKGEIDKMGDPKYTTSRNLNSEQFKSIFGGVKKVFPNSVIELTIRLFDNEPLNLIDNDFGVSFNSQLELQF